MATQQLTIEKALARLQGTVRENIELTARVHEVVSFPRPESSADCDPKSCLPTIAACIEGLNSKLQENNRFLVTLIEQLNGSIGDIKIF